MAGVNVHCKAGGGGGAVQGRTREERSADEDAGEREGTRRQVP